MYAIGILPLIRKLQPSQAKQFWYADDANGGGTLNNIRRWWDQLNQKGPGYGYYPNASKTWLLVKPSAQDRARELFGDSGVNITTDGRRLLGACLGTETSVHQYVSNAVAGFVQQVELLSKVAITEPHAAFAAFTHGLAGRWTFLSRTMGNISELFQPLEDTIRKRFLPALTGRKPPSDDERAVLALPARLGGLGIRNPVQNAVAEHENSMKATKPLTELIVDQVAGIGNIKDELLRLRQATHVANRDRATTAAKQLAAKLPAAQSRSLTLASEKGASSWVTALPLSCHGFVLHKAAFRDALCLRYGWQPQSLPSQCTCGQTYSVSHALSCPIGGYPTLRHNEVRDFTAGLLREVCHDVTTEPPLQPLTGEAFIASSVKRDDQARLDISACGFWGGRFEKAFFDVRVFNPSAPSNQQPQMSATYRKHEKEKRRHYEHRVNEIERSSFTPLVFSTTGGMGPSALTFYRRLADLLGERRNTPFNVIMAWMRTRLSFALLRASIMCLRGSRVRRTVPWNDLPADVVVCEGRLGRS